MKRLIAGVFLVVVGLVMIGFSGTVQAQDAEVIGYLQDTEHYPNMLNTVPNCSDAYKDYLGVAQPLHACYLLNNAKEQQQVQEGISAHMKEMKGCKDCNKSMVQADEAAGAYKEQARIYAAQCPSDKEVAKMKKELPKKLKEVCKSCKNKWPGKVGPYGQTPCQ